MYVLVGMLSFWPSSFVVIEFVSYSLFGWGLLYVIPAFLCALPCARKPSTEEAARLLAAEEVKVESSKLICRAALALASSRVALSEEHKHL